MKNLIDGQNIYKKNLLNFQRSWKAFYLIKEYLNEARDYEHKAKDFPRNVRDQYMMSWAQDTLEILGVKHKSFGKPRHESPQIMVGNHLSYLDIPLLLAYRPAVFVAKEEINRWPLIGAGCRYVGIIFVKRNNQNSRRSSVLNIARSIVNKNENVCIFPSGTTSLKEDLNWRAGAFRIAKSIDIPVQPFRISYSPARLAAYIDRDMLIPHAYKLIRRGEVSAQIEFGKPFIVGDVHEDMKRVKAWCQFKDGSNII